MKSSQELKYELFDLDTEYVAGTVPASYYCIKVEELVQQIELAEKAEKLAMMWQANPAYMAANV